MDILIDKYIMSLYTDLEDEVIADIARRVKKTGRYTETAELMAKSMHELGYSPEKIQSEVMKKLRADKALQMEIAENTKAYKQEIQDIIDATVKAARDAGNTLVAEAGNMAWNNDLSMWEQHGVDLKKPNTMNQLILAFQKQTRNALKNLTQTTGFKNTVFGTTGILNMYQREMDLALLKVATGTFSYDQAVNDCVHRLAQSGLRSIDYANGRTYQLDTAVRMSVRTGLSQLSGKVMEENLKSTGQDLVITSQHMGSRPEHAEWQNKVFSFSGKSKKYPSLEEGTGYGRADGLKGVNCTHDFYPFWEGASVIPEDIEYDEQYYKNTQKQRQMERNIRATKREIEAQNAIGGDTAELQSRLRRQTEDYKQFSADAGLKVKNNRLRVDSGTSNLNKKLVKTTRQKVEKTANDSFTQVKTVEDAKYALSNKVGFRNIDDSIDSMDKRLLIDNTNQLMRLENKFGAIHKSEFVDIDLDKGKFMGDVTSNRLSPTNQYLTLNEKYYSDRSSLIDKETKGVKSGFSMPFSLTDEEIAVANVTHEYGHILQNTIKKDYMESLGWSQSDAFAFVNREAKTDSAKYKWYSDVQNKVQNDCYNEIIAIAKKNNPSFDLDSNISDYGRTNKAEFFAEIFMNSQLSRPNELGVAMNEWLEKKWLVK